MSPYEAPPEPGGHWTVADLAMFPEYGQRYEIIGGSLVVSPAAALAHGRAVYRLRRHLERHAPPGTAVVENVGLYVSETTYFVPDLQIVPERALEGSGRGLAPRDVRVAVEVVSPTSGDIDYAAKRRAYAAAGVARYWIVDPSALEITVLELDGRDYRQAAVVGAGRAWRSAEPFEVTIDPIDLF